jgi:hypothetical protein
MVFVCFDWYVVSNGKRTESHRTKDIGHKVTIGRTKKLQVMFSDF